MTTRSKDVSAIPAFLLEQHRQRVFDHLLEGGDPLRADRAVDDAVVAGQGAAHNRGDGECAVPHDGALLARADGENDSMRRVDDGSEILDAVHAETGDREGT